MMIFKAALCVNLLTFLIFIPQSGSSEACFSELSLTAPQQMEALSGSCLQIPCSFSNEQRFVSTRSTSGIWLKDKPFGFNNPEYVLFNSSGSVNHYSMNMTGNLREEDCTTLIPNTKTSYSHIYYFRIMNLPFMATANCHPINIIITDSPWKPTFNISGDLKEDNSVTITCSAPTPCPHSPPRLTWNLQQSPSHTEENPDGTLTTKIQKTITLSDSHDGNSITCSASYPVDGGQRDKTAVADLTLHVKYAPKDTSASISPGSGLVSAGHWVNLTCSSRAKPPISSFTWFKISNQGHNKVSEGDFYSFNVTADTDGGRFYCVAENELGIQTSPEVLVTVESKGSQDWAVIIGGIIGAFLLICLVVGVCILRNRKKKKARNSCVQLGQTVEEPGVENPAKHPEEEEETIHYGEIDFSKRKPESSSDRQQQESTVYAEVPAFQPKNSSTQTAEALEGLYAQVKKS